MADQAQAPLPLSSQSESTSKTLVTQAVTLSSLEEVEKLVKSAIWSGITLGRIVAVEVALSRLGEYRMEWVFETLREPNQLEVSHLQSKFVECTLASTQPLYRSHGTVVQVEVLEALFGFLAAPAVIKLYHCGFANVNSVIQEALIQVRLTSAYTCKLIDMFIRTGSKDKLEVGLVMERLEEDLEMDVRRRKQDNYFTENELRHILECVAEALLFAKLRVWCI